MKSISTLKYAAPLWFTLLATSPCFAGGDPELGKAKSQTCQSCHGPDGNSPTPQFPTIAGQHEDYLLHALREYKSGARKNAIMAGMVAALSEEDLGNLAAYYARQVGLKDTPSGAFR